MNRCDAKIRPMIGSTELQCESDKNASHSAHTSTLRDYAYSGSVTIITWMESDRRNFHGDWPGQCSLECILPKGHLGSHSSS
jgi:hypothetical protein